MRRKIRVFRVMAGSFWSLQGEDGAFRLRALPLAGYCWTLWAFLTSKAALKHL
jgi:hypothetical protein